MPTNAPDNILPGRELDALRATSNGIRLIEPMSALRVQNIPEGKEWLYEVKFDGYRCPAGRKANGSLLVEARKPVSKAISTNCPSMRRKDSGKGLE